MNIQAERLSQRVIKMIAKSLPAKLYFLNNNYTYYSIFLDNTS